MSSSVNLLGMPSEIVLEIFLNMSVEEILQRCRTSTFFNAICEDDNFWKIYDREHKIPKLTNSWKESAIASIAYNELTLDKNFLKNMNFLINAKKTGIDHPLPKEILYKIDNYILTLSWNVENIFTKEDKQKLQQQTPLLPVTNMHSLLDVSYGIVYERKIQFTPAEFMRIKCFFFRPKLVGYTPTYSASEYLLIVDLKQLIQEIIFQIASTVYLLHQ